METNAVILEAIATRKCLVATYNRTLILLAPHILYTKHGELYLDGVTIKRDGALPKEIKMGAYKVIGLTGLALNEQAFSPHMGWTGQDIKYTDVTVFAITAVS